MKGLLPSKDGREWMRHTHFRSSVCLPLFTFCSSRFAPSSCSLCAVSPFALTLSPSNNMNKYPLGILLHLHLYPWLSLLFFSVSSSITRLRSMDPLSNNYYFNANERRRRSLRLRETKEKANEGDGEGGWLKIVKEKKNCGEKEKKWLKWWAAAAEVSSLFLEVTRTRGERGGNGNVPNTHSVVLGWKSNKGKLYQEQQSSSSPLTSHPLFFSFSLRSFVFLSHFFPLFYESDWVTQWTSRTVILVVKKKDEGRGRKHLPSLPSLNSLCFLFSLLNTKYISKEEEERLILSMALLFLIYKYFQYLQYFHVNTHCLSMHRKKASLFRSILYSFLSPSPSKAFLITWLYIWMYDSWDYLAFEQIYILDVETVFFHISPSWLTWSSSWSSSSCSCCRGVGWGINVLHSILQPPLPNLNLLFMSWNVNNQNGMEGGYV